MQRDIIISGPQANSSNKIVTAIAKPFAVKTVFKANASLLQNYIADNVPVHFNNYQPLIIINECTPADIKAIHKSKILFKFLPTTNSTRTIRTTKVYLTQSKITPADFPAHLIIKL